MTKKQKIKSVMQFLDTNYSIRIKDYNTGIDGVIWTKITKPQFIFWQNFGSSANKKNLKELEWIINTIFGYHGKDFDYEVEF